LFGRFLRGGTQEVAAPALCRHPFFFQSVAVARERRKGKQNSRIFSLPQFPSQAVGVGTDALRSVPNEIGNLEQLWRLNLVHGRRDAVRGRARSDADDPVL
jgi:hypothetical protein